MVAVAVVVVPHQKTVAVAAVRCLWQVVVVGRMLMAAVVLMLALQPGQSSHRMPAPFQQPATPPKEHSVEMSVWNA